MTITGNDDLLIEILLWLPAKSLIRFKLVCKRWFSLISSQHFSDQHTLQQRHRRTKLKPSLLLRLSEVSGYSYLPSIPNCKNLVPYVFSSSLVEPTTIWSFSNGLFLLQCRNVENPFEVCRVYNPTTKESRKILLDKNISFRCVVGLNLVFDPSKSPHYKIVCIKASPRGSTGSCRSWWRRCQVEVYDSNTSTWKLCVEEFMAPRNLSFDRGVEWGGRIHWCGGLYFDLEECVVGKHPEVVVPGDDGTDCFHSYVESNGYLHNIINCPKRNSFMIFELQSDYSEWSLKYHFHLDGPLSVLSMVRGESEEEDSMLVLYEPGGIKFYALQQNCFMQVIGLGGKEFCGQSATNRVYQVIETLASV